MNNLSYEEMFNALEEYNIEAEKSISPDSKEDNNRKIFSSPIQIAEFMEAPKQDNFSPEEFFEFTNSFKRILEKENE